MKTTFRTLVRGRTIELPWDLGLPDGHFVEVTIKTCPDVESNPEPPPWWLEKLEVNPSIAPGKLLIKGTRLLAEDLALELEAGRSDAELTTSHPELTEKDVEALRQYVRVPVRLRRAFGAWAEDAEDVDKFLEWNRQQRKLGHPEIEE